ncbi:MAG: hypothetical protein JWP29_2065, partial [Rhodoferax sp.]|nr:hypothetical protein [Rhodoferax sp.]
LLGTGHTRLQMLGTEIQTEKLRILRQLGFAAALIFCAGLAVLLAIALAVVLFWDQRVVLLSVLTLLFIALAGFFFTALRRSSEDAENVFAASLAELQEDLRQLRSAAKPVAGAPAPHEKNAG